MSAASPESVLGSVVRAVANRSCAAITAAVRASSFSAASLDTQLNQAFSDSWRGRSALVLNGQRLGQEVLACAQTGHDDVVHAVCAEFPMRIVLMAAATGGVRRGDLALVAHVLNHPRVSVLTPYECPVIGPTRNPLFAAAELGDVAVFQRLLGNVTAIPRLATSAHVLENDLLVAAATSGSVDMLTCIIERRLHAPQAAAKPALRAALEHDRPKMVALIEKRFGWATGAGEQALAQCCSKLHVGMVRLVVAKEQLGWPALSGAVRALKAVEGSLGARQSGREPQHEQEPERVQTPAQSPDVASGSTDEQRKRLHSIAELLLTSRVTLWGASVEDVVRLLALSGDGDQLLQKTWGNCGSHSHNGNLLLSATITANMLSATSFLLQQGVVPRPPHLQLAIRRESVPLVRLLLDGGAAADASALATALYTSELDVATLLLQRGAQPTQDHLANAARRGVPAAVKLLLAAGVPSTATAALAAINFRAPECLDVVLRSGTPVTSDLVDAALQSGNCIDVLVRHGLVLGPAHLQATMVRDHYSSTLFSRLLQLGAQPDEAVNQEAIRMAEHDNNPAFVQGLIAVGKLEPTAALLHRMAPGSHAAAALMLAGANPMQVVDGRTFLDRLLTTEPRKSVANNLAIVARKHPSAVPASVLPDLVVLEGTAGAAAKVEHLLQLQPGLAEHHNGRDSMLQQLLNGGASPHVIETAMRHGARLVSNVFPSATAPLRVLLLHDPDFVLRRISEPFSRGLLGSFESQALALMVSALAWRSPWNAPTVRHWINKRHSVSRYGEVSHLCIPNKTAQSIPEVLRSMEAGLMLRPLLYLQRTCHLFMLAFGVSPLRHLPHSVAIHVMEFVWDLVWWPGWSKVECMVTSER